VKDKKAKKNQEEGRREKKEDGHRDQAIEGANNCRCEKIKSTPSAERKKSKEWRNQRPKACSNSQRKQQRWHRSAQN